MTKDAFIYGLTSEPTRQRLLEEDTLDLNAAVKKAEMLELAKRQFDMYDMSHKCSFPASISVVESKGIPLSPSKKSYRLKSNKICFFCGGKLHAGGTLKCPARNQTCLSCGKVGHFERVCFSANQFSASSAIELEPCESSNIEDVTASSVLATANFSLKPAILLCLINGVMVKGLLDSGAFKNFINANVALANGLKPIAIFSKVSMASIQITASVRENVIANLEIEGGTYPGLSFGVVDSACTNVILGQAFMKRHNKVIFRLSGPEKRLIVESPAQCAVTVSKLGTYRLFRNLEPGCKPIATKSRR